MLQSVPCKLLIFSPEPEHRYPQLLSIESSRAFSWVLLRDSALLKVTPPGRVADDGNCVQWLVREGYKGLDLCKAILALDPLRVTTTLQFKLLVSLAFSLHHQCESPESTPINFFQANLSLSVFPREFSLWHLNILCCLLFLPAMFLFLYFLAFFRTEYFFLNYLFSLSCISLEMIYTLSLFQRLV